MDLADLLVVVAVAAAVPFVRGLLPWAAVPGPVLELLAGIVLGPAVLGVAEVDATVETIALLGLAFLLFLAGLELDLAGLRGPVGRQAAAGLAASVVLAGAACGALAGLGVLDDPLLVAVALTATALGLVVPLLADAGLAGTPAGRAVIAGASSGELTAVLLLSLLFSRSDGSFGGRVLLLLLLTLLAAAAVATVLAAERSAALRRVVRTMADTASQLRVRLAVLALVGLAAAAERLGFEVVLGAFVAGALVRLLDPDGAADHPHFRLKLEGLGYGFLVPAFFVASGLAFDLDRLLADPGALLRVPLYLALLLLVRGVPALAFRGLPARQTAGVALLQATSLPFLVTATAIGLELGTLAPVDAAALVAAGLVSVVVYPAVGLRLLAGAAAAQPSGEAAASGPRNDGPGRDTAVP